jgi:DNA-binding transcriptional LysR family regulator
LANSKKSSEFSCFIELSGGSRFRPPVQDVFLETEEVVRERLMVALPERHRFRERTEIVLADLADEPFLMCSINCEPGLHKFYHGLIQDAGFRPRVVQEATHIQTQVGLVAAGVGISLVPSSAASLQQAGVVYRLLAIGYSLRATTLESTQI